VKAIVVPRYGPPDVVQLREMEKCVAEDNEVLVKVHAASVNALDWRTVAAKPFLVRLVGGLRRPKRPRLGTDVAGVVEALGKGATEFHPGDEVFGLAYGAFGEYVSAAENEIVRKPAKTSFETAAAVPIAGFTALQALRDTARIQPGQKVLVNGAGGGVGTLAVQIAKSFGAEVTATSNPQNLELLRSIGADHVIDYSKEDFTRSAPRYDVILDMHPSHSIGDYKRVLNPQGIAVMIGFGGMFRLISVALRAKLFSKTKGKRVVFMGAKPNKKDLGVLGNLLESGTLAPVIERRFALTEVPEALRLVESGQARGKVVITVVPSGPPAS